jgi:hypothetical protein
MFVSRDENDQKVYHKLPGTAIKLMNIRLPILRGLQYCCSTEYVSKPLRKIVWRFNVKNHAFCIEAAQ